VVEGVWQGTERIMAFYNADMPNPSCTRRRIRGEGEGGARTSRPGEYSLNMALTVKTERVKARCKPRAVMRSSTTHQ